MGEVIQLFPNKQNKLSSGIFQSMNQIELLEAQLENVFEDYKKFRNITFVRGYWGFILTHKFAFVPVHTEDVGWIWLIPYFHFKTNTGYDKHGWRWVTQGRSVTYSKMEEIKKRFFYNDGYDYE